MSGNLPFGLNKEALQPGAVRQMTAEKLQGFAIGGTKKTPFQAQHHISH